MIKKFCDACGKEIERNFVSWRYHPTLQLNGKRYQAEIMITKDSRVNDGDLCWECILKIVNEGMIW